MRKKHKNRLFAWASILTIALGMIATVVSPNLTSTASAASYNFIDATRIVSGNQIFLDSKASDDNHEYVYNHDGCQDKFQINHGDYVRGSSDGTSALVATLYSERYDQASNGCVSAGTTRISITNRGARNIFAYLIDEDTFFLPQGSLGDNQFLVTEDTGGYKEYVGTEAGTFGARDTIFYDGAPPDRADYKPGGIPGDNTIEIQISRQPPSANAYPTAASGPGSSNNPQEADESCESAGDFAWALCPVAFALSGAIEWTTTQISRLLEADRDSYTHPDLYRAWANIRNIALSLLIILMLVMVIATALNMQTFDAYTVKRAFPRMVAAIIFISLSWYICIFLIDIFNLMGSGVVGIMTSPFKEGGIELTDIFGPGIGSFLVQWIGGIGLAIGIILIIVFFWSTILIGIGTAFFVLLLRQLFILVLMLIAPLAILAWIFPGNDKFWKTWWGSFSKLLMMYPLIMALLAAGRIFAYLTQNANQGGAAQGFALDPLIAIIAFTIPFAFIPFTFKFAGGLFATVSGMANDRSKGLFDRAKKSRQDKAHRWAEGNAFKGGDDRNFRGKLNKGIDAATKVRSAGFRPNRMRTNIRTAMSDAAESDVKKVMEDDSFGVWSGDDAKVSAAKYTSHDEIAEELERFDGGRFAGEQNRARREEAVSQIMRSQRAHGSEAFQRARVRAMSKTGTGYQYKDANGQTQVDTSRMIDDINAAYGDDRNGAGKALAEMRNNLAQSGHIAGLAGYGTWAGAMESRYRGTMTNQEAHEAIMDDTIDSVSPGQAIYGKPASAAAVGAAHARKIKKIAAGVTSGALNPVTGQAYSMDDLSSALAGAAGIYDAMGQASPQNASALANELMGVEIDLPGQTLPDGSGGTVSIDGLNVRQLLQTQMAGNPEFANRRRDLTQATLAQAQALQAGAAGGNAAPPANPAGGGVPGGMPMSDRRVKEDVSFLHRTTEGIKVYKFKYIWSDTYYVGVMAQDLLATRPETVVVGKDGYYRVRYDLLGMEMVTLQEWESTKHQTHKTKSNILA